MSSRSSMSSSLRVACFLPAALLPAACPGRDFLLPGRADARVLVAYADAAGAHHAGQHPERDGDSGDHDAEPDRRGEHQLRGPVDDVLDDPGDELEGAGQPRRDRQQRPGEAAHSGGQAATTPGEPGVRGAEDGQDECERRPGGVVDGGAGGQGHGSSLRTRAEPGLRGSSGCDPSPTQASPATTVASTRSWRRRWRRTTARARPTSRPRTSRPWPCSRTRGCSCRWSRSSTRWRYDGAGGSPREKSSDMAAVLMTGRDGRTALLAFTGTASLDRWAQSYEGGEARPVPVPARQAAQAALQDQAAALLVDVAGPVLFVVEGEDLESLAAGHRLSASTTAAGPGCSSQPRGLVAGRLDVQSGGQPCTLVPDRSPVPARAWMIRQAEASSHPHRPFEQHRSSGPGQRAGRRTPSSGLTTGASVRRAEAPSCRADLGPEMFSAGHPSFQHRRTH